MSDLILNGTTYSGSPTNTANPQRPSTYTPRVKKIGTLLEGADGSLAWVHRAVKREWTIGWRKANQTTQTAVLALRVLTTTFAFVDHLGVSRTVMTVGDDAYEEDVTTDRANAYKYDLELILRET